MRNLKEFLLCCAGMAAVIGLLNQWHPVRETALFNWLSFGFFSIGTLLMLVWWEVAFRWLKLNQTSILLSIILTRFLASILFLVVMHLAIFPMNEKSALAFVILLIIFFLLEHRYLQQRIK